MGVAQPPVMAWFAMISVSGKQSKASSIILPRAERNIVDRIGAWVRVI
jgi:hypothetical protein